MTVNMQSVDKVYQASDFQALQAYSEQTPTTFHDESNPVLHYHGLFDVHLEADVIKEVTALAKLAGSHDTAETVILKDIDVWVTTAFVAFSNSKNSISAKAGYTDLPVCAKSGDMIELDLRHQEDLEDTGYFPILLYPAATQNGVGEVKPPSEALYDAINDCSALIPDPEMDDDELFDMGSMVTAENMHQYSEQFEDAELGPGAGHARTADDAFSDNEDESKWQRSR